MLLYKFKEHVLKIEPCMDENEMWFGAFKITYHDGVRRTTHFFESFYQAKKFYKQMVTMIKEVEVSMPF